MSSASLPFASLSSASLSSASLHFASLTTASLSSASLPFASLSSGSLSSASLPFASLTTASLSSASLPFASLSSASLSSASLTTASLLHLKLCPKLFYPQDRFWPWCNMLLVFKVFNIKNKLSLTGVGIHGLVSLLLWGAYALTNLLPILYTLIILSNINFNLTFHWY